MEDFIFESHTAIISQELLFEKLSEQGIEQEAQEIVEESVEASTAKVDDQRGEKREPEAQDAKGVWKYKGNLEDWDISHADDTAAPEPEDSL